MREVFSSSWRDRGRYQSRDPRAAMQLVPGGTTRWYVFEIWSRDVIDELIKRKFGIYVPECEETTVRRGRRVERRLPLFPGYVFVFLWETDDNWNKIADIHGVEASIGALSEADIDQIRLLENQERPIELQYFEQDPQLKKQRKRRRKVPRPVLIPDEIVRTRAWSAFDDIVHHLDGAGRSEALRQMLDVGAQQK